MITIASCANILFRGEKGGSYKTFVATISIITIPTPFLFFTPPLSTFLIEGLLNFALFSKIKCLCVEKLSSVFPCVLHFPTQSNNCNKQNQTKPAYG